MVDLKKLRADLAAKKAQGQAKTARYNALVAKTDRTDAETAEMAALDGELSALETEVTTLAGEIEGAEATIRRNGLFATGSRPALLAGRTSEPNPETTFGFKSMAEFGVAVRAAAVGVRLDERLAAASTYNSNQGASGEGFLVPPEYSASVWDIAFNEPNLLQMANPEPTGSNSVLKPKDETTPWGATGVQAYWRAEAASMTASKLAVSGELMQLHELYAFTAASDELLSDAPLLQDRLTTQAGRAISWKASEAIAWGTGAGQPTGFMKAPSLITVNKDSAQAAATLSVSNLGNMLARLLRVGGSPIWLANPDIIPQLIQLTIGNVPAYLPFNRPLEGSPFEGTIFGHPVMFTEHMQTLGTSGDLVLANMAGYYAATKAGKGVEGASSMHLYFDQNLTAFRWIFRLAGQPFLSKPVSPAKGSTTKSHFIALQDR